MENLEFGYRCKDIITGFEGIVGTRGIFITGCDRVQLIGGITEENKQWFDVPTLEVIDTEVYDKLQNIECNQYNDIAEAKYDFGMCVQDKITNFEGTIIGKAISINGDISYGVSPKFETKSTNNDAVWIDEGRINVIQTEKKEVDNSSKRTGGAVPSLKIR